MTAATSAISFASLQGATRHDLGEGAWVDHVPFWTTGHEELMEALEGPIGWRQDKRWMFGREVWVPRLLVDFHEGDPLPHPALVEARALLDAKYAPEFGEPFVSAGLALYRHGKDSVAWHGDRYGRGNTDDTAVAILALGAPRPLVFRRRGGGPELLRLELGLGDLAVMGGTNQRTMDHCVPKAEGYVGPRISVQFRMKGVW